jgi:hypothetical protein
MLLVFFIWFLIGFFNVLLICFEFGLSISIWFYFDLDMAWVLGYDLDMVFDMTLIWFGNGAACSGLLMGWFNRNNPGDRPLVDFLRVFLMVLI